MSLLSPTPGELIDRLLILELKVAASQGKQQVMFLDEQADIQAALGDCLRQLHHDNRVAQVAAELRTVHRDLWRLNEQLAVQNTLDAGDEWTDPLQIWRLNNQRSVLIRTLNRLYGIDRPPEKIGYGDAQTEAN